MIKEIYQIKEKTITLKIFQNTIESVRKNNITKTACRVYKDGFIGISSTLSEPTKENWEEAINNLDKKIVAGYSPEKNKVRERITDKCSINKGNLIETIEQFLERFKKEYPNFTLSQKISLVDTEEILKNDKGLEYIEVKKYVLFDVLAKHKESEDIYDIAISESIIDEYDEDKLFVRIATLLDGFENVVDKPKTSRLPIILFDVYMGSVIKDTFNGEFVHKDASLLSGKVGQKIFNDKCSICLDKGDIILDKFFDEQGSTLENDRIEIIQKGVFTRPLTDKKLANETDYECTAAAGGTYDGVPRVENKWLRFKQTADNLKELVGDREAILLLLTMGGDCTNEGEASLPALTSYLYRNGEIIGRLPRFNISFNILKMLGEDYIGTVKDSLISNVFDLVVFEGTIS